MDKLKLHRGRKGFTLVELLIVIIIIAVLAAIAIPKFANSSVRSKEASLKANLKLFRNAAELFRNDTGAWPATLADLAATTAPANGLNATGGTQAITASDWKGPYVQALEPDSVSGAPLAYTTTGANTGKIASSATGNDSTGVAYSTY